MQITEQENGSCDWTQGLIHSCVCQALFALSSMLRHFPYAQQQFLKLGGLQVLRNLFKEKGMEALYVRVVTLLYDLIMEKVRDGWRVFPGYQ